MLMYFYKMSGTIARKIRGDPPANEYVVIDKKGVIQHIKDEQVLEEQFIDTPKDATKDQAELYKDVVSSQMAKTMLFPNYRKKKLTKSKVVKKCKCT